MKVIAYGDQDQRERDRRDRRLPATTDRFPGIGRDLEPFYGRCRWRTSDWSVGRMRVRTCCSARLTGLPDPGVFERALGIADVADERLEQLAVMSASKKVVPAGFQLAHIVLPPGSKPGKASAPSSSASCGTATRSASWCGPTTARSVRPTRGDLEGLELELVVADLATVEQRLDKQRRAAKSGDKAIVAEVAAMERAHVVLADGVPIFRSDLDTDVRGRSSSRASCSPTSRRSWCSRSTSRSSARPTRSPRRSAPTRLAVAIEIEAEIAFVRARGQARDARDVRHR